jgi:hypothetical protein
MIITPFLVILQGREPINSSGDQAGVTSYAFHSKSLQHGQGIPNVDGFMEKIKQ